MLQISLQNNVVISKYNRLAIMLKNYLSSFFYFINIKFTEQRDIIFIKDKSMLRAPLHQIQSQDCLSSFLSHMCNSPLNRKLQTPNKTIKHSQKLKLSQLKKKLSPPSHTKHSIITPGSPKPKIVLKQSEKRHKDQVYSELVRMKSPRAQKVIPRQIFLEKFKSMQRADKYLSPPPRPKPSQRHEGLMSFKSQPKINTDFRLQNSKINFTYKSNSSTEIKDRCQLPILQNCPQQKVKQFQQPENNYQDSNVKTRESYLENSNSTNKNTLSSQNKKSLIQGPRFAISIAGSSNGDFQDNQQSLVIQRCTQKLSNTNFLMKLV